MSQLPAPQPRGLAELALTSVLGAWLWVTATNQHPNRAFDWARPIDKTGALIPNWRFFAPNPAIHDHRVAHRMLLEDGTTTDWIDTHELVDRRSTHALWFPSRRRDKAISDMVVSLLDCLITRTLVVEKSTAYRCMSEMVRRKVEQSDEAASVTGFQFVIGRDGGYDETEPPAVVFSSRFEPHPHHAAPLQEVA